MLHDLPENTKDFRHFAMASGSSLQHGLRHDAERLATVGAAVSVSRDEIEVPRIGGDQLSPAAPSSPSLISRTVTTNTPAVSSLPELGGRYRAYTLRTAAAVAPA